MTDNTLEHIKSLGVEIPPNLAPAANYVPYKTVGNLLYISGQTAKLNGKLVYSGKAGLDYSTDEAYQAARLCGLNIISQLNHALEGSLDRIKSCVRLNVFINSVCDFAQYAQVANGASDLMVAIFQDKGKHTRTAVGSINLPSDSLVEIDAIFEVENA